MKTQSGFTLIEMVAVIIILAIMAATALPKFANLTGEARYSSVQGLAGGLRSAAALSKSKWLAAQSQNQNSVDMGGTFISVINFTTAAAPKVSAHYGYPMNTTKGIWTALDSLAGYESSLGKGPVMNFWPIGIAASSGCLVKYVSGTVTVSATAATCV